MMMKVELVSKTSIEELLLEHFAYVGSRLILILGCYAMSESK